MVSHRNFLRLHCLSLLHIQSIFSSWLAYMGQGCSRLENYRLWLRSSLRGRELRQSSLPYFYGFKLSRASHYPSSWIGILTPWPVLLLRSQLFKNLTLTLEIIDSSRWWLSWLLAFDTHDIHLGTFTSGGLFKNWISLNNQSSFLVESLLLPIILIFHLLSLLHQAKEFDQVICVRLSNYLVSTLRALDPLVLQLHVLTKIPQPSYL